MRENDPDGVQGGENRQGFAGGAGGNLVIAMKNILERVRGTEGAENIAGALQKHCRIVLIYAAVSAAAMIINVIDWTRNMAGVYQINWVIFAFGIIVFLGVMLPVSIALTVFLKDRIKIIKPLLTAGFAVSFIGTALNLPNTIYYSWFLFRQIIGIIITLFRDFAQIISSPDMIRMIFMFFFRSFQDVLEFVVIVLFLLILIFNIKSGRINKLLFALIIAGIIIHVPVYIHHFVSTAILDVSQNWDSLLYISSLSYFISRLSWYAVQFLLVQYLVKTEKLENTE
jgi:hypothetical protein